MADKITTSQNPHCTAIAPVVSASPPMRHATLIFDCQITVAHATSATTGTAKNRKTTNPSVGAGICIVSIVISNRMYAVGLKNIASHNGTRVQAGKLGGLAGFNAFMGDHPVKCRPIAE
jgi:hypothetical protein